MPSLDIPRVSISAASEGTALRNCCCASRLGSKRRKTVKRELFGWYIAEVAVFKRVSSGILSLTAYLLVWALAVEQQGIIGNCAARFACSSEFTGDGQQGATLVVGILEGLLPQSKHLEINILLIFLMLQPSNLFWGVIHIILLISRLLLPAFSQLTFPVWSCLLLFQAIVTQGHLDF